jgi:hypothetical protein
MVFAVDELKGRQMEVGDTLGMLMLQWLGLQAVFGTHCKWCLVFMMVEGRGGEVGRPPGPLELQ